MTTNYHTAPTNSSSNDISTIATPLAALDSQITVNTSELATARSTYANLDSRLNAIIASGGNVSAILQTNTLTTTVTVDSTSGFTTGNRVGYVLTTGAVEYNTATVTDSTTLTLGSVPSAQIDAASIIFQISESEYQSAGGYATMPDRLDGIDQLPGALRLAESVSAGASSVTLRSVPSPIAGGDSWLVLSPYTPQCEIRQVSSYSGATATLRSGTKTTRTTISFTNSTGRIASSSNGLHIFKDMTTIVVSGSGANDGTYTISSVQDDGSYLVVSEAIADESAGASITISVNLNFDHSADSAVMWTSDPVWNVLLFGAVADYNAVNTGTDSGPGINRAIVDAKANQAAISTKGGAKVYIPSGNYKVRTTIIYEASGDWDAKIDICGDGFSSVLADNSKGGGIDSPIAAIIKVSQLTGAVGAQNLRRVDIHDLYIIGGTKAIYTTSIANTVEYSRIYDNTIKPYTNGLYLEKSATIQVYGNIFDGTGSENAAVYLDNTSSCMFGVNLYGEAFDYGIYLTASTHNTFVGGRNHINRQGVALLAGSNYNTFVGMDLYGASTGGRQAFEINASHYNKITSCTFERFMTSTAGYYVEIVDSTNTTVSGCAGVGNASYKGAVNATGTSDYTAVSFNQFGTFSASYFAIKMDSGSNNKIFGNVGTVGGTYAGTSRSIFISAQAFKAISATVATVGTSRDIVGVLTYADAATQQAIATTKIPDSWLYGSVGIVLHWASAGTGGDVRWTVATKSLSAAEDITAAAAAAGTTIAEPAGANLFVSSTTTVNQATAAGETVTILVERTTGASDTSTNAAYLLGVSLLYTGSIAK